MGAAAEDKQQQALSSTYTTITSAEERVKASSPPVVDTKPTWDLSSAGSRGKMVNIQEKAKGVEKKEWNTKNLSSRLLVDAGSAATAGGLVAPVIMMVDKWVPLPPQPTHERALVKKQCNADSPNRAIIENASGKRPMLPSLQSSLTTFLTRPHRFLTSKPFALIFMLYSGTYLTANTLDTLKSTTNHKPASSTSSGPSKFAATSAANLSLCLYKDSQFTRMFGVATTAASQRIPPASYALFAMRDCLTIFASFNLPPLLAPSLPISEATERYISRASAAQFMAPAAFQLVSTPLHLLGLDLYNRGAMSLRDRLAKVRVDWLKSSLARMCRIVPAFGFGGVVNNGMRKRGMGGLE